MDYAYAIKVVRNFEAPYISEEASCMQWGLYKEL